MVAKVVSEPKSICRLKILPETGPELKPAKDNHDKWLPSLLVSLSSLLPHLNLFQKLDP